MLSELVRHGRGAATEPSRLGSTSAWRITNWMVDLFALPAEDGVTLVDTGLDPAGRPVDLLLGVLGAQRGDVRRVMLTHGHPDHVAAARLFPQARVFAGRGDLDRLTGRQPGTKLAERTYRRLLRTPGVQVTDELAGPRTIEVGGAPLHAIPMPGDTPGAYAFAWSGLLFIGDVADRRGGRLRPARAFATDDPAGNRRSIRRLPTTVDSLGFVVDQVCTSHGGPTPRGQGRARLDQLVDELGGPLGGDD